MGNNLGDTPKALFLFWEGYLDVSPTLIALLDLLTQKGYEVEVVIGCNDSTDNVVRRNGIRRIETSKPAESLLSGIISKNIFSRIMPAIAGKLNQWLFSRKMKRFSEKVGSYKKEFDVVFCVDATGLFTYSRSGIHAKKVIYLSLEILELQRNAGSFLAELKQNEVKMLRETVNLVIIQDKIRKAFLERTVGFSLDQYTYLPNSVCKAEVSEEKGRYFYDLFNLPIGDKIILSAGMISESVCSLQIAKVINAWQARFPVKVIFHERMYIPGNVPYYQKVAEEGGSKIRLSLQPVPFDEIGKVFSSADIGLAIYNEEAGDNFGLIGSASGKLFQYIKYGVPVIASALPGLKELVEEYQFGIAVKTVDEIPSAIEKIFSNYSHYSSNARKAFNEKLNMDLFLAEAYYRISA